MKKQIGLYFGIFIDVKIKNFIEPLANRFRNIDLYICQTMKKYKKFFNLGRFLTDRKYISGNSR